jgi:hypothetical protein
MALNSTAKNLALEELADAAIYISLHTADPGSTGTSEVTGGTYARKSITWAAASSGAIALSNQPVLDVPAGTTITHIGLWSAVSGGTFYGGDDITSEAFVSAGTYRVDSGSVTISG